MELDLCILIFLLCFVQSKHRPNKESIYAKTKGSRRTIPTAVQQLSQQTKLLLVNTFKILF